MNPLDRATTDDLRKLCAAAIDCAIRSEQAGHDVQADTARARADQYLDEIMRREQ